MQPCLLDTDTLSEIIKARNPIAQQRAAQYLVERGTFAFSTITRYEILRGLKAKNATVQLASFDARCRQSTILPLTDDVVVRASDLYGILKQRGQIIGDADLLIAATALTSGLVLVTSNTAHFSRIPGLALDCWTTP